MACGLPKRRSQQHDRPYRWLAGPGEKVHSQWYPFQYRWLYSFSWAISYAPATSPGSFAGSFLWAWLFRLISVDSQEGGASIDISNHVSIMKRRPHGYL